MKFLAWCEPQCRLHQVVRQNAGEPVFFGASWTVYNPQIEFANFALEKNRPDESTGPVLSTGLVQPA
jgi:hypothetical protein